MQTRCVSVVAIVVLAACSEPSTSDPSAGSSGSPGAGGERRGPPKTGPADDPDPVDPTNDPGAAPCTGAPGELYALRARALAGREEVPLCRFKGAVLLIVNVASHCGYTPQYAPLQQLYEKYRARTMYVLGFPSNSFNQEKSDEKEISELCTNEYKITFPMFAIGNVNPPNEQPVYTWLKAQPGQSADVAWNFEKFLVSRSGAVVRRFPSSVEPTAPELTAAIESELAK